MSDTNSQNNNSNQQIGNSSQSTSQPIKPSSDLSNPMQKTEPRPQQANTQGKK